MNSLWIDPPKWKKPCTGNVFECNNYEDAKLGCDGCALFKWKCNGVFMVAPAVDHRPKREKEVEKLESVEVEKQGLRKRQVSHGSVKAKKSVSKVPKRERVSRSVYYNNSSIKKGDEVAMKTAAAESVVKDLGIKIPDKDLIRKELLLLVKARRSGKSLKGFYFSVFEDFFEDIDYVLRSGYGWRRIVSVLKNRGYNVVEDTARKYWSEYLRECKKS